MDAINEYGMAPDAPAPEVPPMTLRQVLDASHTYFGILRYFLHAGNDDEARGRMLAQMDHTTALLESEVARQLAQPQYDDGAPPETFAVHPAPRQHVLARVA